MTLPSSEAYREARVLFEEVWGRAPGRRGNRCNGRTKAGAFCRNMRRFGKKTCDTHKDQEPAENEACEKGTT